MRVWVCMSVCLRDGMDVTVFVRVDYCNLIHASARTGTGEMVYGVAELDGAQEVPMVTTSGRGTGVIAINVESRTARVSLALRDLMSTVAKVHIHAGAPGTNGAVVVDLGVATNTTALFLDTTIPLTEAQLTTLLTTPVYFNIHTGSNGTSEIRGDITFGAVYGAVLTGGAEVPSTTTPARGVAALRVEANNTITSWLTLVNLDVDVTGLHIHGPGAVGSNGPVVLNYGALGSGVRHANSGSLPVSKATLQYLGAGLAYFNVHTARNPAGEVRGQCVGPAAMPAGACVSLPGRAGCVCLFDLAA